MVAMAMLASPGFHALRLHSTAKTTWRSLPHKSIPSFAGGRTAGTYIGMYIYAMRRNAATTTTLKYAISLSLGYAIVAGLRSKHPRWNVAASQPRAPLTLRLRSKPIELRAGCGSYVSLPDGTKDTGKS